MFIESAFLILLTLTKIDPPKSDSTDAKQEKPFELAENPTVTQ